MVATYPLDAVFDVNNFSVIGTITYQNTGSNVAFVLASGVNHKGEVLAFGDGILQETSLYTLAANSIAITFLSPPDVSNLTLKSVSVPSNLTKLRTFPSISVVEYSNSSVTTVNSNAYIIDGLTNTFAVPESSSPASKSDMLVTVSGAAQASDAFIFPSSALGDQGIDVTPTLSPNETLQIRTFDSTTSPENDRCRNMADRRPDAAFPIRTRIPVDIFRSTAGYEKRRLITRRAERAWQLTYTNVSGTEKQAIDDFYKNRFGEWEAFLLDLTHINEPAGFATVRFDGELDVQHNASKGTGLNDNFYTISLRLTEVYD